MTPQTPSSKPFAAWVTDLIDKYRFDSSVRTTLQIVLLQAGLTLLSILVFGWAIQYAQQDTISYISRHIQEIISGDTPAPNALPQSIIEVRQRTYLYMFTGLIILNVLFGYLIAHFALRPTRQTLSLQKRLIGNIAHEIRTPLAIIKTSTEVALFDPDLPADLRKTFEDTIVELNRISETINNLLSFDSLTRPNTMRFEPVDLSTIAHTVYERHLDLAESRGITLKIQAIEHAYMNGNTTALEQVITNLTKNAINYTPQNKGGQVTIEVDRALNGGVFVAVMDTGIGIAQKDLYHIFEPFFRADTSRARGIGTGTSGLGLAIVNEIVRLHHGTITVRSAVKHGTTIRISFPPFRENRQELPLLSPSGSPHEATLDFS
ncbi:MAG: sensor histidine kinase [Bacillota bacterium]